MSHSIKALKLVIAALMSLKDKKGSSLQRIAKYLITKYSVRPNIIKPLVYTGLIKGMKYGLIKNDLGYYRLNPVLNSPLRAVRPTRPRPIRSSGRPPVRAMRSGGIRSVRTMRTGIRPVRTVRNLRSRREVKAKKPPVKRARKQKFCTKKEAPRGSKFPGCSHKNVKRKKTVKAKPKRKPRRIVRRRAENVKKPNNEEKQAPPQSGVSDDSKRESGPSSSI